RLPLHVLAVGIIATCREFPEATMLNDKVIPALRALLLERCIAHGFGSAILSDNLFGITTFRITGAGQEKAETAALDGHGLAALLTGFSGDLRRGRPGA